MTEHQSDTHNKWEKPVTIHFNLPNHLIFIIIEILQTDPEDQKSTVTPKTRELHWIYQLHTLWPVGIIAHLHLACLLLILKLKQFRNAITFLLLK